MQVFRLCDLALIIFSFNGGGSVKNLMCGFLAGNGICGMGRRNCEHKAEIEAHFCAIDLFASMSCGFISIYRKSIFMGI